MTDPIREAFERHIVGDDDRIDYTRTLSRNPATDEYLSCEVEEAWTWYQKGRADLAAWKDAVTDALVIGCIYSDEHDNDPRKAVADLVAWETKIALDPAVSSEARALIERGRADLLAEQAKLPSARVTKADFDVLEGMLSNLERTNETLNKVHAELLSPPQPAITDERVALTDGQIVDAYAKWDATPGASMADFARMIERALLERKP